jgi:glycosyltransferase involved in cell wall biosynthesis
MEYGSGDMKRILFVRDSDRHLMGGIQGKVLSIAHYLADANLFVPLLATSDMDSTFARRFAGLGFAVHAIPVSASLGVAAQALEAIFAQYDGQIAVVQSHMFRESMIVRTMLSKYKLPVRHVFRVHTHIKGSDVSWWRRTAYHALDCITARYVDKYVPISDAVANELTGASHIDKCKVRVVRNGIPQFGPPDVLQPNQNVLPPRVAVIGDLQERKQQHFAVEVVGMLKRERGVHVELHLIGGAREGYLDVVKECICRYGLTDQVKVHGYMEREQIGAMLEGIDVVWLPSRFEGVPTSIIEGMSMKKLVIATPVGGTCELVCNGRTGFLHEVGNHKEAVCLLKHVFTTPRHKFNAIRERGYTMWRDQYALANMMDGLLNIYKELGVL